MAISITVHQIGVFGKVIQPENVPVGIKIELKKTTCLISDYIIGAYVDGETLGYVSEVPMALIEGTQVLTEELYEQLPDYFEGVLEKKEQKTMRTGMGMTTRILFEIKINDLVKK